MQIETLKIFCDVVRRASVSKAAKENGVSQSSASQAISQLEAKLEVKLIDRSKRPLQATRQGAVFYEGCREIVARFEQLEKRVRGVEGDEPVVGVVRVASIYSAGLSHIQQFARQFEALHKGAEVRVDYLHPTRVVEAVVAGEADLGLISFPRKHPDLVAIPWREEEMVLALSPRHRLAGRGAVDAAEIAGEAFVGFDANLSIRRAIDRFLKANDVHVRVVLAFDNVENIKRAVEISSGVAILPRPSLASEVSAGTLVAASFQGPRLTRPLAIVHRKGDAPGATAAKFLELLRTGADPAAASASPSSPAANPRETAAVKSTV